MEENLTTDKIRRKFKKDTGKNAIITQIKEGKYISGLPKKIKTEQYNPAYTMWLENLIVELAK
jgi:hypothetical protein